MMKDKRWIRRAPWLALVLMLAACESSPEYNVLIVTLDTTRADHLGAYGDTAARTPVADQLAAEGILFEQAITPIPITLPAHSTLMTGKVPFTHGVRDNGLFILDEQERTLAEILSEAGYQTAAAVASFPVTAQFGIDQGFEFFDDDVSDRYENVYGDRVFPKRQLFFDERPANQVNEAFFEWMDQRTDDPFFAWIHYFDPHHPHQPPPPYDALFAHDLYRGEIAFADESLGVLFDRLKAEGVYDDTLIIVTADHGEGNGEHNESTHSLLVYQSTLHVPLIIKPPAGDWARGRRVADRVGLVDVMPTILELLEMEVPESMQGLSLRSYLELDSDNQVQFEQPLYAETLSPRLSRGWGEQRAIIHDDMKYIHGPKPELYDLNADPKELNDLMLLQPERAEALKAQLEAYLAEHAASRSGQPVNVDEDTLRRLQGLGYIQSGAQEFEQIEEVLRSDGDPPQQHVETISTFSLAKNLLHQGEWIRASRFLKGLLSKDPGNPAYLELLLQANIELGQYQEALEHLDNIADDSFASLSPSRKRLLRGRLLLISGDPDGAFKAFQEAEALEETVEGQMQLARMQAAAGNTVVQLEHLERALAVDPNHPLALLDAATLLASTNRIEEAEALFERLIRHHRFFARGHYNHGVFLLSRDQATAAKSAFERAVRIAPDYLRARYALFELLWTQGFSNEARVQMEWMDRNAPGTTEHAWASELIEQI